MLPQIQEVNFPSYATLHQATVNLADMGDKTITADVKIDGAQRPDFIGTDGNDWEVLFRGERFIHPLREPQAHKDNASICSLINMTFYHWAIYQMKRYFWVALANVDSGTPIVDKYIASIAVNLPEFARALDDMLRYYLPGGEVYVYKQGGSYINPDFDDYDKQTKYIEIDHSYIWDVLQKTYELFGCRWSIVLDDEGRYAIKFGYPLNTEISHKFQYGYDGALTSIERQVQDDDIRNQLLGRGGEKNLPYMYFKDYERFHPNSENIAYKNIGLPDPDAIPELENILFTEIRDKNFRSYVQGWKVNIHRQNSTEDGWGVSHNPEGTVFTESNGDTYSLDTARMETDWAYAKGATDTRFDPVEYVKDDESIETFGLLQGGLENNEEAYPTIQGMELELPCSKGAHDDMPSGHKVITLADEIVDVEEVETDVIAENIPSEGDGQFLSEEIKAYDSYSTQGTPEIVSTMLLVEIEEATHTMKTAPFTVQEGYFGNIILAPKITAETGVYLYYKIYGYGTSSGNMVGGMPITLDTEIISWGVWDANTGRKQKHATNLPPGEYYLKVQFKTGHTHAEFQNITHDNGVTEVIQDFKSFDKTKVMVSAVLDSYSFDGEIVANTTPQGLPISETKTIPAQESSRYTIFGGTFVVPDQGAINVDCPIELDPATGRTYAKTVKILNTRTSEFVINSDIPAGEYQIVLEVDVTNTTSTAKDFTVSLGPAHVNYNHDYEDWKPTFDIWIKNIFSSNRGNYTSDDEYMRAIWAPLISTQEMTVAFSTGNLSRHSDWEFKVLKDGIAYDNSKILVVKDEDGVEHEVRSEWRLTLIKTDAEADAIHKYVPYKDFNAQPYDRFILTNIYLPWAYVYAAEAEVNAEKENKLEETKNIQPAWVIKFDKNRMEDPNYEGSEDLQGLIWSISPGDKLWVRDSRFTPEVGVQLYVASMSYTWQGDGALLPDIEVVLSDKVETSLSTVQRIQNDINVLSNQLREMSSLERTIRKVGDAIYLRKDGFEDTSYSPTNVARRLSSTNYRSGIVGGQGWSADSDGDGNTVIEVDRLLVRKEMMVNNLVVNQVTAMGGKEILSAAGLTISEVRVIDNGFECYFDTHNGTIGNLFRVDDVAMSQVWDEANNETKYYRCRVIEVGRDYITLSFEDKDGDGAPAVGDVVAQYGNYTDTDRQYVIIRDVIGGGYERMLSELNSVTANGREYYFAGIDRSTSEFVALKTSDGKILTDRNGLILGYNKPKPVERWFVGNTQTGYAEYLGGTLTVMGRILVKGDAGATPVDISYLTAALPKDTVTQITNAVVLSTFIGVKSGNNIVAAMNGSTTLPGWQSNTLGTVMFAAGISDMGSASTPLSATTKIWSSGKIVSSDVELTGRIVATEGKIGSFQIDQDDIVSAISDENELSFVRLSGDVVQAAIAPPGTGGTAYLIAQMGRHGNMTDSTINGTNVRISRSATQAGASTKTNIGHNIECVGTGLINKGLNISLLNGTTNYGAYITALGGTTHYGIYVDVSGGTTNYGVRVSASGGTNNYAFYCPNGVFAGLRPRVKYITDSSSSKLLSDTDFTIIVNNQSEITISLPSSPKLGQMYQVSHTSNKRLNVSKNNGKRILSLNAGSYADSALIDNLGILFLVYAPDLDNGNGAWVLGAIYGTV